MTALQNFKKIPKQKELALKLGWTEAYISLLLAGKRNNPKALAKLERAIKQSLSNA
ncbi:MAG: hypothetical protein IPM56_16065 [Ignavibacteriales bacterium]|nr:MAG: hypothetical protein IPM56_16065 [Ignavibacteriales bacterium]